MNRLADNDHRDDCGKNDQKIFRQEQRGMQAIALLHQYEGNLRLLVSCFGQFVKMPLVRIHDGCFGCGKKSGNEDACAHSQ